MTVDHDPAQASDELVVAVEAPASAQAAGSGEPEPDDLLRELSRAMHRAALSQHKRMIAEVARMRSTQAEAIKRRTAGETEQLTLVSDEDIQEIDAWAQTATQLIAAERVRRIDARRERLQAQLARQGVIIERELMAVDVTLEDHEAALEAFFTHLETETDPSSIASLASAIPSLPSLSDAADAARRHAIQEFAPIEDPTLNAAGDDGAVPDLAVEVSPSRLMAVMDPEASRGTSGSGTAAWPEPGAVTVAAGTGDATGATGADDGPDTDVSTLAPDEDLAAVAAGSGPLLRSMTASRPFERIRNRRGSPEEDPNRTD